MYNLLFNIIEYVDDSLLFKFCVAIGHRPLFRQPLFRQMLLKRRN